MYRFKKFVSHIVRKSDLLCSQASLRYEGEGVHQSFCPGIFSIIVVSIFLAIFIIKLLSVIQFLNITAFQHLVDNIESAEPIRNAMFAMSIDGLTTTEMASNFQFQVTQITQQKPSGSTPRSRTQRTIALLPCKIEYWQNMGIQNIDTIFNKRAMSQFFCPTQKFIIQGTIDEDTYIYADLKLSQCTTASAVCESNSTKRAKFIQDFVDTNSFFTVRLYLRDAIISPTEQTALTNYIQRDILITFSTTTGTTGYIKIADYEISTDISILPWSSNQIQTGYYIERLQTTTVPVIGKFMLIRLEKSTKKLTVQRQIGKIDDLLSYVGGLFGLLFYCVQFVMGKYNEYRYELGVGEVMFNFDQKRDQVKEQDMNFWMYVKYSFYAWLDFFGINIQWKQMQKVHETRQESNQQIDIRYLMSRIRYLQNALEVIISEDQKTCLLLTELPTLSKIQKIRKVVEFYNKHRHPSQQQNSIEQKDRSFDMLIQTADNQRIIPMKNSKQSRTTEVYRIGNQSDTIIKNIIERQNKSNEDSSVSEREQDEMEEQLAMQISGALRRLYQNNSDPINKKILSMLKPEVLKKIDTKARRKSFDIRNEPIYLNTKKEMVMKKNTQ